MKIFKLLMLLFTIISIKVSAQGDMCGTDHGIFSEPDTKISKYQKELDEFTKTFIERKKSGRIREEKLIIPVVFHVVYGSEFTRPTEEQLADAIRVVNEDFSLKNPERNILHEEFRPIAANMGIEFRIASLDPLGKPTSGINYIQNNYLANNNDEEALKGLINWPRENYLNIWVVNNMDGVLGYASFPSTVAEDQDKYKDGLVMVSSVLGTFGTAAGNYDYLHVFSHELGHWMNLKHIWGHGGRVMSEVNCNFDDEVEDTPMTTGNRYCGDNYEQYSCGSLDNVQNYMEYTTCMGMFTNGQKDRALGTMYSSIADRSNLWTETNLILTGILEGESQLVSYFDMDKEYLNPEEALNFIQLSKSLDADTPIANWEWNLPGSNLERFIGELPPAITYPAEGIYTITLKVSDSKGNEDTYSKTVEVLRHIKMGNDDVRVCDIPFFDEGVKGNYLGNRNFSMTIYPEAAGGIVQADFKSFSLYYGEYGESDYLKIYSGTSSDKDLIGIYKGTELPGIVSSYHSSGALTFEYKSSHYISDHGWEAYISCVDPTDSPILGITSSKSIDYPYTNLTFENVSNIGEFEVQSWEWEFEDGSPAQFSGFEPNGLIRYENVGSYDVTLTLTGTNGTVVEKVFEDYVVITNDIIIENGSLTACSGIFTDDGGSDEGYSNDVNFTYTIFPANDSSVVTVDFEYFEVEEGYDELVIYNGPSSSSPVLQRLTGFRHPGKISARNESGALTFEFDTDESITGRGWKANIACEELTESSEITMTNGAVTLCEGLFTDSKGIYGEYDSYEDYIFTIYSGEEGKQVAVDFQKFATESGYDVLTIYNGETADSPILVNASGNQNIGKIVSNNEKGALTFRFESDGSITYDGWEAIISCEEAIEGGDIKMSNGSIIACEGTFTDSGGSGLSYSSNEDYVFSIFAGEDGKQVKIDFNEFEVESDFEKLYIYDGENTQARFIGVFTGTNSPGEVISNNQRGVLTFRFTSDSSIEHHGWLADVSCVESDGTDIKMTDGVITTCEGIFTDSGGRNNNYDNNEDHTFTIIGGDLDKSLVIDFTSFSIESGHDHLYVYNGSSSSATLLGQYTGESIESRFIADNIDNALTFVFVSDGTIQSSGWEAEISCLDNLNDIRIHNGEVRVCEGIFTDTGGQNGSYQNNENYVFTIYSADDAKQIAVDFEAFSLEEPSFDRLEIFDGSNVNAELIGTYGSQISPGKIVSNNDSRALTFRFTSDGSVTFMGWVANISCEDPIVETEEIIMREGELYTCEGTFTDSGGSRQTYGNDERKVFTIYSADDEKEISVDFTSFDLEDSFDFLTIYNGKDLNAEFIGTYTGTNSPGAIVSSNDDRALTFVFSSDKTGVWSGWTADVSCQDLVEDNVIRVTNGITTVCDGIFTDTGGSNNGYQNNESFIHTFTSGANDKSIAFDFEQFQTSSGDELRIYNGEYIDDVKLIGVYSGSQSPGRIVSNNSYNALTFKFTSNNYSTSDGWRASIECVDKVLPNDEILMTNGTISTCGGTFTDSGSSVGFYEDNENKTFTIFAGRENSQLGVEFTHFELETGYDNLFVYDGVDQAAELIGQYTGTTLPEQLMSNNEDGALTFVFISDFSEVRTGWVAELSCIERDIEPVVDFEADSHVIYQGESIQFTDLSTGSIRSWSWTISSSDVVLSSSEQNPVFQFDIAGVYDVKLEVENELGSMQIFRESLIEVLEASMDVLPVIEVNGEVGAGKEVNISGSIDGYEILEWEWNITTPLDQIRRDEASFDLNLEDLGAYIIELRVRTSIGWSGKSRKELSIILSNIEEASGVSLVCYPNPVQDEMIVELENCSKAEAIIIDNFGRKVRSQSLIFKSGKALVYTDSLVVGLYTLEVLTENGERLYHRFIVER
ncbi:CUB domain-containing protein [Aureibacter tunicatorum]|uniref:PKD repeat protein n=1 Tax=Aureibacter tunicatorum TaxID=866807 RepID=A0AAE3XT29_9BACT|nr:CUB domain-containing protein [Aureibacter tunicatorum]MDR6241500.1 PKD repeat protein [Aureibacter tunicatorum]BDD07042.1 hypothetical protein AUTU_45250 [Aureibacter tunicatorum]